MKTIKLTEDKIEEIRNTFAQLCKNLNWERTRNLMPYDADNYVFPLVGRLADLLKIKRDGTKKKQDKRGAWR